MVSSDAAAAASGRDKLRNDSFGRTRGRGALGRRGTSSADEPVRTTDGETHVRRRVGRAIKYLTAAAA